MNIAKNKIRNINDRYIAIFIILLISLFVYKDIILLKKVFVYNNPDIGSDTVNSYLPQYTMIMNMIASGKFSPWSFNMGVGTSLFSMGTLLWDPFNVILFLFGSKYLVYGLGFVNILRIIIAGFVFNLYLSKFSLGTYSKIVGTILYAFNGYMILWGQHYFFGTLIVLFPLLLLAFEKWLIDGKWVMFSLIIMFLSIYSLYFLYMISIYLVIYATLRYIMTRKFVASEFFMFVLKSILIYLLGICIGAVIWMPSAYILINSPRVTGKLSSSSFFKLEDTKYYITTFLRLFSNSGAGTGAQYAGSLNYYESPMLYSGIATLLLIPQLFRFLDAKKKILYIIFLSIFAIFLIFPYFSAMFNGFSAIQYRWTFLLILSLITFAVVTINYIDKEEKLDIRLLIETSIFLICGIVIAILLGTIVFGWNKAQFSPIIHIAKIVSLFLIIYCFTLALFNKYKNFVKYFLVILICMEVGYFSFDAVNHRNLLNASELKQKKGYYDYTQDAISYLNKQDKDIYRIDKSYMSVFLSDSLMQNYKGTKAYNSLNQPSYIKFLTDLQVPFQILNNINYITGLDMRPNLQDLIGVKYYLSKDNSNIPEYYEYVKSFGDVKLYKNKDYLPLGYAYNSIVNYDDFMKLSVQEKDDVLLKACVINGKNNFDMNTLKLTSKDNISYVSEYVSKLKNTPFIINSFSDSKILGTIDSKGNSMLFISIPYDKGWRAKVDGKSINIEKVNLGFIGIPLSAGKHDIELKYFQPNLLLGLLITLISTSALIIFTISRNIVKSKCKN